jgi:hypothetical protein
LEVVSATGRGKGESSPARLFSLQKPSPRAGSRPRRFIFRVAYFLPIFFALQVESKFAGKLLNGATEKNHAEQFIPKLFP